MTEKLFTMTLRSLKAMGLADRNKSPSRWWLLLNALVIFNGIEMISITLYGTIREKASVFTKLEYIVFIYTNISVCFRLSLMTIKKKQIFALLDKMEALLLVMEAVNGTNSLPKLKRRVFWTAIGYSMCYAVVSFNIHVMAYIKYYFQGMEAPVPYDVYIPFERKHNLHAVACYELVQYYSATAGYAVTNIYFVTLGLATAEMFRQIGEGYKKINPTNLYPQMKQTAKWHAEVITLVKEANSMLSPTMMIEFLLSMQFISIIGFLLVRVGSTNSASFSKYLTLYFAFLTCPLSFCLGGHILGLESDLLYNSVHDNEWYLLAPKKRRDLILPTTMAYKGISWNYRRIIYFDMALYLDLVKQSYSFIAFLKMMSG